MEATDFCPCFLYNCILQNFPKPVLKISPKNFPLKFPKNKTENSSDKYSENNIQQQWTNPHSTHPSNHSGRTSTCSRRRQDSHTAEVTSPDSCTGLPVENRKPSQRIHIPRRQVPGGIHHRNGTLRKFGRNDHTTGHPATNPLHCRKVHNGQPETP